MFRWLCVGVLTLATLCSLHVTHVYAQSRSQLPSDEVPHEKSWGRMRVFVSYEDLKVASDGSTSYCSVEETRRRDSKRNIRGLSLMCHQCPSDNQLEIFSERRKNIMIDRIIPKVQNWIEKEGPLARRIKKSLILKSNWLKKHKYFDDHDPCYNIKKPDVLFSANGIKEKDIVLMFAVTLTWYNANPKVYHEVCAYKDGRPAAIVINVNPCFLDDNDIDDIVLDEVKKALGADKCPSKGALLLPNSKCVDIKCQKHNQEMKVRFDNSEDWKDCSHGRKVVEKEKEKEKFQCPAYKDVCYIPPIPLQSNWGRMRVFESHLDLEETEASYCTTYSTKDYYIITNLKGDQMFCHQCPVGSYWYHFPAHRKDAMVNRIIPKVVNWIEKEGPLVRRAQNSSVIQNAWKQQNSDDTKTPQPCSRIKKPDVFLSDKGIGEKDLAIFFAVSPFNYYDRSQIYHTVCASDDGRVVGLVVNVNPCYLDHSGIDDVVLNEVKKALGVHDCPSKDALRLPRSNCVNVKCEENDKMLVQFKGDAEWRTCAPRRTIRVSTKSLQCLDYKDVCNAPPPVTTTTEAPAPTEKPTPKPAPIILPGVPVVSIIPATDSTEDKEGFSIRPRNENDAQIPLNKVYAQRDPMHSK